MAENIQANNLNLKDKELKEARDIMQLRGEIAKLIHREPKSEEELIKELKVDYNILIKTLKNMIFLKLIKKNGFPAKYSISDEIAKKLMERKEIFSNDKNAIRLNFLIESKSDNKAYLEKLNNTIVESLKKDERYTVYNITIAETTIVEGLFSTYISAEVSCANLVAILSLIYYYGITSIDIIKPDNLKLQISDLQSFFLAIIETTQNYSEAIFKLTSQVNELNSLLAVRKKTSVQSSANKRKLIRKE
ncbi:MAG: hypothetical protein V1824_01290 [archaeon]